MTPTLPEIMNAMDELQHFLTHVIDRLDPIWPEDENRAKRAMAVLHAHVRALNGAGDAR